ncbi:hypothetical protein ME783_20180 [Lactobacillus delbrueckii]|nr:hypothetical protein ME783_20180 [Lactobacillus delbrueckii]
MSPKIKEVTKAWGKHQMSGLVCRTYGTFLVLESISIPKVLGPNLKSH